MHSPDAVKHNFSISVSNFKTNFFQSGDGGKSSSSEQVCMISTI